MKSREQLLTEALQALLNMDVNGHALQDRLQFSDKGRDVFCARTLWKHSVVRADFVEYVGVSHNALDDARFVATRMLEVVR